MITHPLTFAQIVSQARQKGILALCMLGLCTLALSLSASAQKSTFATFDFPGSIGTAPTSINSTGVITGSYVDVSNVTHGFLRAPDGTFTSFDVPGAVTFTASINPAGEITGTYYDANFVVHGFLRDRDGTVTTLYGPGGTETYPTAINPAGTIIGIGFLRSRNGTFTTCDVPGSVFTIPMGINPAGAIAGWYYDANGIGHGFLRSRRGTFTTFDAPGAITTSPLPAGTYYTTPVGINPAGAITGYYSDVNLATHGFVRYRDGSFTVIDAAGSAGFTKALGISGTETIMGLYFDNSGTQHAFVRSRDGTFTTFDPPGSYTYPTSINTAGAITGSYNGRGFLLSPDGNRKESH